MTMMGRVWLSGIAALCVTACGDSLWGQVLQPVNHDVVINEIHHDPDVKTEAVEFIELYNNGDAAVDLSGWSLTDAALFTFPAGTSLASRAYLVVAENPTSLQTKFKVASLGPWTGRLSSEGERIVLADVSKRAVDQVTYQLGFPWPTVGDSPGYSIELIHPSLDNDLGGNWRASVSGATSSAPAAQTVFGLTQVWKYNQAGTDLGAAWRASSYNDASWPSGPGLLYVEDAASVTPKTTALTIGRITYYFRTHFTFSGDPSSTALQLSTMLDDGAVFYLNGTEFYRLGVADGTVNYNTLASRSVGDAASEGPTTLTVSSLVKGDNVLAVEVHQVSASSSDVVFGMTLATTDAAAGPGGRGPTPGKINSVYSAKSPPAIRQVAANPPQPAAGQVVTITAKVTDPQTVAGVSLSYQGVEPGAYVSIDDTAYSSAVNWTTVAMKDGGTAGDAVAGDGVYSVQMAASLQTHRRLIRYRITAVDAGGQSVAVPYADDPQPNFAYFVYSGVPAWSGAIQPGSTDRARNAPVVYDFSAMPALPVYHLITMRKAHEDSQYIPNSQASAYSGSDYLWAGTLVYNGVVYDHVHFRARGGVWRYSMGKNMWKFDFNRGHELQAYDEYGRAFKATWKKLNLGANIQQGDYQHRGEQGLFEYTGWRLYNLTGLPSSMAFPVHFRIVERASETNDTPSNQYDDDFQGLYLALEQPDGRLLDQHGLPDGNLYKMEGGGQMPPNNQGPDQPSNGSDLSSFISGYSSSPTEAWWRANFDLAGYYSFRAITEAIHNGDIGYGKNYFYYHNPETSQWSILAWDLDLTWAENMFGNGDDPFKARVLFTHRNYSADREPFNMEFRNRLQEVMDLLFNADQTGQMIDEYSALVDSPASGASMVDADRAMWDYNPILVSSYVNSSKAGQGRFYQVASIKSFRGMGQLMKNYIRYVYDNTRNWMNDPSNGPSLTSLALDPVSPEAPTVTTIGSAGYPLDHLKFRASAYSGSIGVFGAMKWRIAEVSAAGAAAFDPASPRKYEIEAAWDSGEITSYRSDVDIPPGAVEQGKNYRVRCRMRDSTGRWSGWSNPVQFVAGAAAGDKARLPLVITEIMYNPPDTASLDGWDRDDFEYVELMNAGSSTISLSGVRFTAGITFDFADSSVTQLSPGQYVLVVKNRTAFECRYGTILGPRIAGEYGDKLSDGGERIRLVDLQSGVLADFEYKDSWYASTDGQGMSLVPVDPAHVTATQLGQKASWRASTRWGGLPGGPDTP